MVRWLAACAAAVLSGAAAGQDGLYAVRGNGDLLLLNVQTGAGSLIGGSGVACDAAMSRRWSESLSLAGGGEGTGVTWVSRWTGATMGSQTVVGVPAGYRIAGLAVDGLSAGGLFALLKSGQTGAPDLLARLDGSQCTVLTPLGRTDLEDLATPDVGANLVFFGRGTLYKQDPQTGLAVPIGGGGYVGDEGALAFLPDGRLLACGSWLSVVDPLTGVATPVGPTGFSDIRGLGFVSTCYADCDHNIGTVPILTVNDFICFQVRFSAGDPYCNCDLSTTPPVLNVNDFVCFLNAWVTAAGCG